jgi:AcrR family transcriptional regulator
VFAELGYGAATVRDIVRETNLASGTFYNYFPDKESVLRALVEESANELADRVRVARARAHSLEQFVGDAYLAYFEFIARDTAFFELLRRNTGTIRSLVSDAVLGGAIAELERDLREAIARGDLATIDTGYMASAMAGVAFEVASVMVERDPVDPVAAARFATALFLGGIERLTGGR